MPLDVTTAASLPSSTIPRRTAALACLAAAELVLLYAPTVRWLFGRWTMSVWHNAHGLLIPPVVAYFIYLELRRCRALPVDASAWGFAFVIPALALRAVDAGMHTELLSAVSIVLLAPGLSLLTIGRARTRAILFPLMFLWFALPIPLAFTERLHWELRTIATTSAAAILPLLDVPVFVEGTTLHTARGALQVADACSGFSTLYAAMAVACLVAYSIDRVSRRVLVMVSAAPIAIASNVVRVVLLVLLVGWRGDAILETPLHPLSGVLTFALSLPVIFWMGGRPRQQVAS